jgi:hypothetical protein
MTHQEIWVDTVALTTSHEQTRGLEKQNVTFSKAGKPLEKATLAIGQLLKGQCKIEPKESNE